MSKLLEDPKIQALVDKEVTKAIKAERARVTDVLKILTMQVKDAATEVKSPSPI